VDLRIKKQKSALVDGKRAPEMEAMDLDSVVADTDPAASDRRCRKEVKGEILAQGEIIAGEIEVVGIRDEKVGVIEGGLVLELGDEVSEGNGVRGLLRKVVRKHRMAQTKIQTGTVGRSNG
jgi:hypothetical protein